MINQYLSPTQNLKEEYIRQLIDDVSYQRGYTRLFNSLDH